jgi:cytochrome c peroxidase
METRRLNWKYLLVLGLTVLSACASPLVPEEEEEEADPAQVAIGERLFQETRFAQFFFANSSGVNVALPAGDPVLAVTETLNFDLAGPFAGKSMNCAACHLVDQQLKVAGGGMRTYADFAERSPIPAREDGKTHTPRNSPPLVNSALPRPGDLFLHFDGEFGTMVDLVKGTFTGRNFGWLPGEDGAAIANLAKVIREDNGLGDIAQTFDGLPYRVILTGTDPSIPFELQLPLEFRVDVASASDQQIFDAVARLVSAYVDQLIFSQDARGNFNLSPFDEFLRLNELPRRPEAGESDLDYSRRLFQAVNKLQNPVFVTADRKIFAFHKQAFEFGPTELEGMRIFFREPEALPLPPEKITGGGIGNCIACHAAPSFSDFSFHNTGVTQREYNGIHGDGAFQTLFVPDFAARQANPQAYLPASNFYPEGTGVFLSVPQTGRPELTDLGLWNVFANDAVPKPQPGLRDLLCRRLNDNASPCTAQELLPLTLAAFKTPGLRDPGHSDPYMHNGKFPSLEAVALHYLQFSEQARSGGMRNPPAEFQGMALRTENLPLLVKFLDSLNEDYE